MVIATWASEQNGNVLATAPAEEGKTVVEEGGERDASGESFVVESERAACHPVRTNEALVFVHSEEQRGRGVVGRQSGNDPCVAEVLAEGTLFGDAGADAVGAFDLLGPDAAEPDSPAFEIVGAGFIAAMVNRDSRVVAQENDVALLADDGVKTIDLFSCVNDDVGDGFFRGI